ncbi:MAG: histidine phosphatase family protein [Anaerolineae bacterium]
MKLLLTRHGQSRWQTEGESAGADAALSALGATQAHQLGHYLLRHEEIDRIVTSPLQRARTTAQILTSYLDVPLEVDADLREFGSREAGEPPLPVSLWDPTPGQAPHPQHQRFRLRVRNALERIVGDGASDETVLIVAHGGVMGTALRMLLGASTPRLWTANTGLHALEWTGTFWMIHYVNRQEHLPPTLRSV